MRGKPCEGCHVDADGRFRIVANLFLCAECWEFWQRHGRVQNRDELTARRELVEETE